MAVFKKNIIICLGSFFSMLMIVAIITFLIDPYQHYRKSVFYKPYSFDSRYMVWGMIKNYDYDSLLIGSSMTANFRKNYVDSYLNLDILRVPVPGATAYEENLIMQKSLRNKKLSTILYGLDLSSFTGKKDRIKRDTLPSYLMNESFIDDLKYLLNIDVFFRDSLKIFLSNFFDVKKNMIDFNTFWNWDYEMSFGSELCINDYSNRINSKKKYSYKLSDLIESFNYNIMPHFESNIDVEFIIFFPPRSILAWKVLEEQNSLEDILKFKKYILEQSIKYDNVKVYDFQIAKDVTHNLDNYMDTNHYSGFINKWIIKQIKNEKYLVSNEDIRPNIDKLRDQVSKYVVKL